MKSKLVVGEAPAPCLFQTVSWTAVSTRAVSPRGASALRLIELAPPDILAPRH